MSQTVKRTAGEAFAEDIQHTIPKNKKARKRTAKQDQPLSGIEKFDKNVVPNATLKSVTAVPQHKSNGTSLEDRITSPISTKKSAGETHKTSDKHKRRKSGYNDQKHSSNTEVVVKKKSRNSHHSSKHPKANPDSWVISTTTGGVFIDHDPILTLDGQYLILPTKDHIHVYSTSTSLLVRSILIKEKDTIVGCVLSTTNSSVIIAATNQGAIVKCNISNGNRIGKWTVESGIKSIASVASEHSEKVYVIRSTGEYGDEVLLLNLQSNGLLKSARLLQQPNLQEIAVIASDKPVLVVRGNNFLQVGQCGTNSEYTWYKMFIPALTSSFDVRANQSEKATKMAKTTDVVVGLESGAVFLYEDVLGRLIKATKSGQKNELGGRKLHWHRNTVRSVKWSKDGNYVISGGDETVLVIWQLDTNQRQYLPHLTTSILNIAVSSNGSQYALRLGDNSAMILSTADLLPSTNITGLSSSDSVYAPMQLHPTDINKLLAAVSIRPKQRGLTHSATHLQVYDIDTQLQLGRQALTRSITTTVNVSPGGSPIQEPDVTHLQVSNNGLWLATIDKWSPSNSDLQALYIKDDEVTKQRQTETILRFWSWNAENNTWEVAVRIEEPHNPGQFSVLGLSTNPSRAEFATMGEDGMIKVWQPNRRVRDGVQVKDQAGRPLFNWSCSRSVQVEKTGPGRSTGVLTYSEDGSVIMASWSGQQRQVHVIDPTSGSVCMSLPNLLEEGHACLASTGRYLLCLTSTLKIVDMIALQTSFTMDIRQHCHKFLTVNSRTNTFAIGLNHDGKNGPSVVSIFGLENPEQGSATDFELPAQICSLLSEPSGRGFVVVDSDATVRKLIPPGGVSNSTVVARVVDKSEKEGLIGLEGLFGHAPQEGIQNKMIDGGEHSSSLTEIFSAASTAAQPSVLELFDRVSKVISAVYVEVPA